MNNYNFQALLFAFILFTSLVFLNACTQERFTDDPSAQLRFETDTLTFDTIFASVGSTTQLLKIYNDENKALKINNISLGGGGDSFFRINVNGTSANEASNVEIGAKDSLYIFVEATIDPNEQDLPFLVTDSLVFETNGNWQKIDLVAYGQNARYFSNVLICDEVFTNEKPYLLYNDIVVEENCTLTIKEGVRMHMHPKSNLYVLGTLIIEGTKDSLVSFQGDRLEDYFDDLTAQWSGIYMLRGSKAQIKYVDINESIDGIAVGFPFISEDEILDNRTPELIIENSTIRNCLSRNILGLRANITATNCLFINSSLYNVELAHGGNYNFTHCTLANYGVGSITHRDPILRLANYARLGASIFVGDQINFSIKNSIIHGSEDEELFFDDQEVEGGAPLIYTFENCIVQTERNIDTIGFVNCIKNPAAADTLFVDKFDNNFRLNNESPAINSGITTNITTDIEGNARDNQPDLGCYEFQE